MICSIWDSSNKFVSYDDFRIIFDHLWKSHIYFFMLLYEKMQSLNFKRRLLQSGDGLYVSIFVSPAKQKRDICIAFPAASLSSAVAA